VSPALAWLLLAQAYLMEAPPADTRPAPRYVVVLREWDSASYSYACLHCEQPRPQWVWRTHAFADLPSLAKAANGCGAIPCWGEGALVGAWDLEQGRPIQLTLKVEKKSRPRVVEAQTWEERTWEVAP
jgi:hypothetical protein